MSKALDNVLVDSEAELREAIAETFDPATNTRQVTGDDDADVDGMDMLNAFGMRPLDRVLDEKLEENHPMATEPRAFIDAIVHLDDFDELLLDRGQDLSKYDDERYPEPRRSVLEWCSENTDLGRLNKGGTDTFLHGLPGSTKTTCLQYIAAQMQSTNYEDVVWAATPGRSEWVTLGRWATVLWPSDLEKTVRCVPINPNIEPFTLPMDAIARDVVEYDNPEHLMDIMRSRPRGEFYVTYPDPKFRLCEYFTGLSYTDVWHAEELHEKTDLIHWWFAWAVARVEGDLNTPTSFILDESDELLDEDAAKDEHDTYQKVKLFRDSFRDFRKTNLSLFLAAHRRDEVNLKVRKKLRWTLTMNQEAMPSDAPVDGDYTEYMDPGEGMIWKSPKRASISWPNMGKQYSVPAKFVVEYPGYDAEERRVSGVDAGGESDA